MYSIPPNRACPALGQFRPGATVGQDYHGVWMLADNTTPAISIPMEPVQVDSVATSPRTERNLKIDEKSSFTPGVGVAPHSNYVSQNRVPQGTQREGTPNSQDQAESFSEDLSTVLSRIMETQMRRTEWAFSESFISEGFDRKANVEPKKGRKETAGEEELAPAVKSPKERDFGIRRCAEPNVPQLCQDLSRRPLQPRECHARQPLEHEAVAKKLKRNLELAVKARKERAKQERALLRGQHIFPDDAMVNESFQKTLDYAAKSQFEKREDAGQYAASKGKKTREAPYGVEGPGVKVGSSTHSVPTPCFYYKSKTSILPAMVDLLGLEQVEISAKPRDDE